MNFFDRSIFAHGILPILLTPLRLNFAGAGPAGGKVGCNPRSAAPDFARRLLDGSCTSSEFHERMRSHRFPEKVSLVLNNSCNLACRHCYLQVRELTAEPLSVDEWEGLSASILDSGTPFFSLAGKEVFLGRKNQEILRRIHALNKARGHPARLGLITNGTLIQPFHTFLKGLNLDYLDISLDGTPADHDAVRGEGAFAAASPNVRWAASEMPDPFFLSMTLQRQNYQHIAPALQEFANLGVSNAGLSFFVPTSRTDPALNLSAEQIAHSIISLADLGELSLPRPMTVIVELNTHTPEGLEAFIRSPWFAPERITTDRFDNLWIEHRLPNGLLLQFKFLVFPSSVYRVARITPEGNYLASDDIFETELYRERILTNVREHDLDFRRTHAAAKRHPRAREILIEFEDSVLPGLRQAFKESLGACRARVA